MAIVLYVCYSEISQIAKKLDEVQRQGFNTLSVVSMIKDKLDVKDKELEFKKFQINKSNANYEAFNGTACMRCHLESSLQLPLKEREELNLQDYIKIVRSGIGNIMPSYVDSPRKGPNEITDQELRRQYKILKPFYDKQLMFKTLNNNSVTEPSM